MMIFIYKVIKCFKKSFDTYLSGILYTAYINNWYEEKMYQKICSISLNLVPLDFPPKVGHQAYPLPFAKASGIATKVRLLFASLQRDYRHYNMRKNS